MHVEVVAQQPAAVPRSAADSPFVAPRRVASGFGRSASAAAGPIGVRRVRLITGLTLFTYVGSHLLNHSTGNFSVAWMEAGLVVQKFFWQGLIGFGALYIALLTHYSLGLWAFYGRRHYGWRPAEVVQLILGLSIPLLITNHVFATRISLSLYGTEKDYAQELFAFWVKSPLLGVQQFCLLLVAWTHGCIGVFFWLRLKPAVTRFMPLLLTIATLLPVLALLGFLQGGRTIVAYAEERGWRVANLAAWQVGTLSQNAELLLWRERTMLAEGGLLVLVLLLRGARAVRERRGGAVRISYPDGRTVQVPRGFSVLDASRVGGIPHASVCGGRARCSTCRIRIVGDTARLPPPSRHERALLARVRAAPGIRLACQLYPTTDVAVFPLLPTNDALALRQRQSLLQSEERFIAVLVVDMRNSTRLAETRLPFDAVFIIDRFIAAIDAAIGEAGGHAHLFTGDGLIATFGLTTPPEEACRRAINALILAARNVAALNEALAGEMAEPIRFGAGMHAATAVVGEVGYGAVRLMTTLGDPANVAARLETLCKSLNCEAVISEGVCRLGGLPAGVLPRQETAVRGRGTALTVCTVATITELARLQGAAGTAPA